MGTESERQDFYIRECGKWLEDMKKKAGRDLTCGVFTFGCQMNFHDSEKITAILERIGYVNTGSEDADFVLYNTCTVRENANERVYGRLGQLKARKKDNPGSVVALCGCMMQEEGVIEKIKESYDFVDIIFGTYNIFKLAELLYTRIVSGRQVIDIWREAGDIAEDFPARRKYPFKAGINIMYGCDNFCSYCIVPYVRGRERSRKLKDVISEAERLAGDGVKEIMLLGQNVNSYGKTLSPRHTFAELLARVGEISGIERIRFMTSHPKDLSEELIGVMRDEKKVCGHIHLPLQSGSTRILKKMNRHYTKEGYLALVDRLRDAMPDISITTDIIVGFPGETDGDFAETLDVVRKVKFDSAFTFKYSKRTGTPAAAMPEQVPDGIVKARFDELLSAVREEACERTERFAGQVMPVLVEEINAHDPDMVTGRLENNTVVHFYGGADLIGRIVDVRLSECRGFYYIGEKI